MSPEEEDRAQFLVEQLLVYSSALVKFTSTLSREEGRLIDEYMSRNCFNHQLKILQSLKTASKLLSNTLPENPEHVVNIDLSRFIGRPATVANIQEASEYATGWIAEAILSARRY